VAACAAGLSATGDSRVPPMLFALPSRNFLLRPLLALGLKSAKSAMTPPEYAAYTSAPTIPWIARADPLWPIVNGEEIARRESRRRRSLDRPYRRRVLVASPVWAAQRPVRGARLVEGSNGRSLEHAQTLAASHYSTCVGILLGLGSGGP